MSKTLLQAENLSIHIQNKSLLNDINFSINKHDFLFLTGNNGCGKSTFLNILAKYQPPATANYKVAGNIKYNGNSDFPDFNILNKKESQWYNREIYYLKQNADLQGTIYQNFQLVMEPLKIHITREEIIKEFQQYDVFKDRLEEDTNRWFRRSFLDQPINSLSGGQRKIIEVLAMIIRARRSNIKLLLVDEPFNHLDVKNIKKVVELILEVRKINPDLAIIIATHCMAFPSPCSGLDNNGQIESDFFKHYIVTEGTIRIAGPNEKYRQGSCFLESL